MAWSSGSYSRTNGAKTGSTIWAQEAADGDAVISSSKHDVHDQDLANGINACINKDGSNAFSSDADLGGNKVTNMAAGTATGNAGRWNEDVASMSLDGTTLEINLNSGSQITQDLSSVGAASGVTTGTAQTITGKKTFTTNPTVLAHLKVNGPSYHAVSELTSGSSVAVDTTAYSRFYLGNDQVMTLNFTIPSAASDTDLGADFCTSGVIMMRNETGHGAVTLSVTATDTEEIGSRPTGAGDVYSLVYEAWVLNGTTRYVQFTWVAPTS